MTSSQARRLKGRSRLPGGTGRKEKQYKLTSYTAKKKLDVINYFAQHNKIDGTIKKFYPDLSPEKYQSRRTLIYSWRRDKLQIEALLNQPGGANKCKARNVGLGPILPRHDKEKLVRWINELREEGVPVTTTMLRIQAETVADNAGITHFEGSWCWQKHFKQRHRLSLRCKTRQGQIKPPELDKIASDFATEVLAKAAEIGATCIFNADQTGLILFAIIFKERADIYVFLFNAACFDYLPKKIIDKKGSKTVWVRCGNKTKDRATVMLLVDSTGNKFPPFTVFKVRPSKLEDRRTENDNLRHGFSDGMWQKSILPAQREFNMQVYANEKSWWNSYLTNEFLRFHIAFRSSPRESILLLLDDFFGHWLVKSLSTRNASTPRCLRPPPKATSVSQPADATWNGPLKGRLRNLWIEDLREQLRARTPGHAFKLDPPDRYRLCGWIHSAWTDIASSTIIGGFKKCGLVSIDNDEVEEEVEVGDAHEIIEEATRAGLFDAAVGEFSLDDDFDDIFRAVASVE